MHTRSGATSTRRCSKRASTSIKSDFGEQVPDDCVAFNGDYRPATAQRLFAALQPLRIRSDRALRTRRGDGMGPRRVDWFATLSHPMGRRSRNRIGKACARRFAAGSRGDCRASRSMRPTSAASTARGSPTPSSTCAGCNGACSRRTCASPRHRCTGALGIRRGRRGDREALAALSLPANPLSASDVRRGIFLRACR